jgi:hypothetical protein
VSTAGLALALGACSSDKPGVKPLKTADAYVAAIRWYLDENPQPTPTSDEPAPDPLIVYVAPDSGKAISSVAQANVVEDMADLKDVVTVRFADVRDDALDTDAENQPVKDGGVLLLVGEVQQGPPPVDVDVSVYRDANDEHDYVMKVVRSGDEFISSSVTEVDRG